MRNMAISGGQSLTSGLEQAAMPLFLSPTGAIGEIFLDLVCLRLSGNLLQESLNTE